MNPRLISGSALLEGEWIELRTLVDPWEECDEEFEGYDGFSRFWSRLAIFDIYWVAERVREGELALFLTSDMHLTGFRTPIHIDADPNFLEVLAEHLHWQQVARKALADRHYQQFNLFEDS